MYKTIWVFSRNRDWLCAERRDQPPGLTVITPDGRRQDYRGRSDGELARIQTQLEAELRRDGWALEMCTPERRRQLDRRSIPRNGIERRRRPYSNAQRAM